MSDERRAEAFDIEETLDALRGESTNALLPAGAIYGLSDLSEANLKKLRHFWPTLPVARRRFLVEFLVEMGEVDYALNLEPLTFVFFEDEDPGVRAKSVELTWYVTSEKLFHRLMELARDEVPVVRATVMGALGRFIYEAEMEEFDEALAQQARQLAISRYYDYSEDLEVRRRSLEAVSNGTHPELSDMIDEAYHSDEIMMQVSAVFAMGASCDRRWSEAVLRELGNENTEIRFEAARAAGTLEIEQAVPVLLELAQGGDYEVQMMAISSLGEIATREAQRGLELLALLAEDAGDDNLIEAIEDAIEAATLFGGLILPMFDFDEDDLEPPLD